MRIKIKELPVLSKKEVTDQDIMVIETTADTYQIPISDLKVTVSYTHLTLPTTIRV